MKELRFMIIFVVLGCFLGGGGLGPLFYLPFIFLTFYFLFSWFIINENGWMLEGCVIFTAIDYLYLVTQVFIGQPSTA